MLILLITLITIAICVIFSWLRLMKERIVLKTPGPVPLPIVGNGHRFLGDSSQFLKTLGEFREEYGDRVLLYILSERYMVFTHPKHIEPVMSSMEFITKGFSYYFLQPWLGQGLLTSTGNRWKTHRKFLTPAFHFNILQNFLPVFCKNAKILNEKLANMAEGRDIDLFPLVALAALDNVTESIMGVSVNAQKDSESQYVKSIEDLSNVVSYRMRNPFLQYDMLFNLLPLKTRQEKALSVLHGQTRKVIEARKKEVKNVNIKDFNRDSEFGIKNKNAFLDLLLLSEIDGSRIDDESIREEVDTFMFEGHDTTTSGIVFALYNLAKHKDIQEKILEEQRAILGNTNREPTYSEVSQMKYLECVIKESLRLYPSVPLIARLITHDAHVEDMFIPKGTTVVLDIIHMQRRADIYEKPLEFIPERFSTLEKIESKNAFCWLPFSAGPRNCIGQKFAMMEMKVTLATILQKFVVLPSDKEPELCADLILRSKDGVQIKLTPRHN
ncbi:cytochrome P450 4C1-like isoform X2 [Hyposmocoma kahamanoa]|uniref:cytochrome P450 4C1-like isoform X2 n=1 Tax=Hyposmocoma kahamanoa TaxID=1477025 RepID=UPI000E6D92DD|nr:cytochrome P450 4C1-like isoform X2 [Hyposmocoma kahamanoa]